MDRKETRTMEFQKHFQSKTILIFKEEFICLENANLGKVTKIGKKKIRGSFKRFFLNILQKSNEVVLPISLFYYNTNPQIPSISKLMINI